MSVVSLLEVVNQVTEILEVLEERSRPLKTTSTSSEFYLTSLYMEGGRRLGTPFSFRFLSLPSLLLLFSLGSHRG